MTREERLGLLKQIEKDIYVPSIESTFLEDAKSCAIHSVIEELEQEPCEDAISREDALMALTGEWTELTDEVIHRFIKRIKELPSVIPQYTENEIQKIQDLEQAEIEKAYELGKAEGQECEDAISRQAVLDIVEREQNKGDALSEIEKLPPVNPQPKTGHCKECKWWKDKDGVYRRGIGAESSCPFNTKEIYDGDAYCYRFEPQESEGI